MGANFNRLKTWVQETFNAADLNAEFDQIYNNFDPAGMDDYSSNTTEMRTQTDPGEDGTESLATSLAGELARLRYAINEIKGTSYWYESGDSSISELASALGGGLSANRIISGVSTSGSSQPLFLVPAGNTNELTLDATPTAFQYAIESVTYSIGADVTATGLVSAPTSNNTALVDDGQAANGDYTRYLGMYGSVILVDTVGSEITSRDGKLSAFKINDGSTDEYFLGVYDSNMGAIKDCRRQYFFDENGAPITAVPFANNDTITLMKLTWVFVKTAGTLAITYNNPTYAATQPSSPATGDYWFDLANSKWKTFDSAQWVDADAHLIGVCIQDENGNTVGARGFDFFKNYEPIDDFPLVRNSNTVVKLERNEATLSIYGTRLRWEHGKLSFDITSDLASGLSESANTDYFLYVKEDGTPVMDEDAPYDRRGDLKGWYHPHEAWRCVGLIENDGSSNLDADTLVSLSKSNDSDIFSNDTESVGHVITIGDNSTVPPGYLECVGADLSRGLYHKLYSSALLEIGTQYGTVDGFTFTSPDINGRFIRYKANGGSDDPDRASRTTSKTGSATGDNTGSYQGDTYESHDHGGGVHSHAIPTYEGATPTDTNVRGGLNTYTGSNASTNNSGSIITAEGGNETRPKNVYFRACIKYSGDR